MNNEPLYLQAHCQSPKSNRTDQSFVKELAKPTHCNMDIHHHDREEARTGNSRLASCGVTVVNSSAVFQINFGAGLTVLCPEIPHERQAAKRYSQCKINDRQNYYYRQKQIS